MPDYSLESNYTSPVAGVDEAGYGSWAGPVVAAAVILDITMLPLSIISAIDDSKKLSRIKRQTLFKTLYDLDSHACWIGVGEASPMEIDQLNVRVANLQAMHRAVEKLKIKPNTVLIDGNNVLSLPIPCYKVIGGDSLSVSIAAASIIAKVTRDEIMSQLAREYPHYMWNKNAGYGTRAHHLALQKYGVTPYHRMSYKPIKSVLEAFNFRK